MIDIPGELVASQESNGEVGRAFIAGLPALVADLLDRWELRPDGAAMHGGTALVLPVLRGDGTSAVLKLQRMDEESCGEPIALRLWNGDGAVQLLAYHEPTDRPSARAPDVSARTAWHAPTGRHCARHAGTDPLGFGQHL